MATIKDLGKAFKRKHSPAYDDLDDYEVGIALKNKHPGKYEDIVDTKTGSTVQALIDNYEPSRGVFRTWLKRRKSEAGGKLLETLTVEQKAVLEQAAMLERHIQNGEKSAAAMELFLRQNEHAIFEINAQETLITHALENGLSLEVDQTIKATKELNTLEVDKTRQLSGIKVEEHKQLGEIDLNNKFAEMRESVRLAIIAKHMSELQKISIVQDSIDGVIRQIDEIETDLKLSPRAKQRMIAAREEVIETFEKERRGRQIRLLEANNGGEVRGDSKNPDTGGDSQDELERVTD